MKTKYIAGIMLLAAGVFSLSSCSDDDDYAIATGDIISTVETGEASVTAVSATTAGRVLDLSKSASTSYEVGVVYGTNQDPTTAGKKQIGSITDDGTVSTSLSGLTKGTTYYYATYVTLQGKVTKYGDVKSFVATDAKIATADATNITACSATLGGTANGLNGLIVQDKTSMNFGFKISMSEADVKAGYEYPVVSSTNAISKTVKGLLPGKTYYYVSYFQLEDGYVYGDVKSFTTATQTMEYVDLGLSTLWAKCNLGAETEEETGTLAGYGDVTGLKTSTYLVDYTPSTDIVGTASDIVNSVNIDGDATAKSSMPTKAQINELISKTKQEWTTVNGVSGIKFTATNGNSIFLPAAGYRSGETATGENVQGLYWSGNVDEITSDYASTLNFNSGSASVGLSKRCLGLSIRPVRPTSTVTVDNSKLDIGDLEGNGRIRIEIYNEYGKTKNNPSINVASVKFKKNMIVKFKLSGVTGNLKDGAPTSYVAGIEYAAATDNWNPNFWSDFKHPKYDAAVNGDGEYTVWMETDAPANGAHVFCVDIDKLGANVVDITKVKAEIESIKLDDGNIYQTVDNSQVLFVNKDGNGVDGRIEIYNEYGDTKKNGVNYSSLSFNGSMIINYTISGIDGNLIAGASKSYKSELSFADADWNPQYWGGNTDAAATVTGDGTYTVIAPLLGTSSGAVVWTIELYNLWKELVDPTKVKVTINSVTTPGKM